MRNLLRLFLIFGLLLIGRSTQLQAQNAPSGALNFQLKAAAIQADQPFLALTDSASKNLALVRVRLDGKDIWLKKTTKPVTKNNVVHWHIDKASGRLIIDLSGIRKGLTAASQLEFEVAPLNRPARQPVLINVYQAKSSGISDGETPKLLTKISKKAQ